MMSLLEKYNKEAIAKMKEKFGFKNDLEVPKIKKVVINTSFGRLVAGLGKGDAEKIYKPMIEDLSLIAGQRPVLTDAKKSISTFKLRQGTPIGAKVTLRGTKMNDFLDRLINIVLPRTRDFAGIEPKSIDGGGNLNIGIKEQIVFPEVSAENVRKIFGLEVTITTSAKTKEEALELFRVLGFPIKKDLSDSASGGGA
ncbi:50S ribosomal protein L5 [Patescibacteria group bacterium]|nr:50S ribosomal protein L5 [Patescibacteria group bacterium]MBU4078014.1 50S ribosomal protein L5 [Patescibacteria group bacterium]